MSGSAQLGPETSLLAYIEESISSYGLEVNGSVMRRALKTAVNEVFRLSDWNKLVTITKDTIDKKFVLDEDGITSEDFYLLMCSQMFQKMLRTATQKFKSKERVEKKHLMFVYVNVNVNVFKFMLTIVYFF